MLSGSLIAQTPTAGLPSPPATTSTLGSVKPNPASITVAVDGTISAIGSSAAPQYIAPQAISGCGVEYVSGLTYTVGACTYSINGVVYNSPLSNVTLATADPTNPRIDVIFVDTTQVVQVLTGTPAGSPQQPVVDPSTQLQLTTVLVSASSTTPANTTVVSIYLEGTEWTGSTGGTNSARVNLTSTSNPYSGTHDTEFGTSGTVTTTTFSQYVDPAAGTVTLSNYNALTFYMRNKAAWPSTRSVTVQWFNGSTPQGTPVVLSNGAFGFNATTNTTSYQQVLIPAAMFGLAGIPVTTVRFTVTGTGTALTGFYLDQVTLQGGNGGIVLPTTLMNFKGPWSATATYSPNDTVTSSGTGYVALAANTNQVVTNASFWATLAPSGGSLPAGTTGQTIFYATGGTTGTATSALTVAGAAATSHIGVGLSTPIAQLEDSGPFYQDANFTGTVTFGASCSATATSCTIAGGTGLNATGGVVLASFNNGSSGQEYICYSVATSTTLTIGGGNCQTPVTTNGRSYWGSTAAIHANGEQIVMVSSAIVASASSVPIYVALGNGATGGGFGFGNASASIFGHVSGASFDVPIYALGTSGMCLSNAPSVPGGNCLFLDSGGGTALEYVNANNNAVLVSQPSTPAYVITSQAISSASLTAITNTTTSIVPNNNTAGGTISTHCKIIWSQATAGTVQFGIKASAAPTDIWVSEQDSAGVYVAPVYTTITSATTTATSGTIVPTAFGTNYSSDLWIAMNPGTSNNVSVQLYASASVNTITIQPGTGCTGWN